MTASTCRIAPGWSAPLGATVGDKGVNFSIHAPGATAVELCLFETATDATPSQTVQLDPESHRTGSYWHCRLQDIGPGSSTAGGWMAPFSLQRDSASIPQI